MSKRKRSSSPSTKDEKPAKHVKIIATSIQEPDKLGKIMATMEKLNSFRRSGEVKKTQKKQAVFPNMDKKESYRIWKLIKKNFLDYYCMTVVESTEAAIHAMFDGSKENVFKAYTKEGVFKVWKCLKKAFSLTDSELFSTSYMTRLVICTDAQLDLFRECFPQYCL